MTENLSNRKFCGNVGGEEKRKRKIIECLKSGFFYLESEEERNGNPQITEYNQEAREQYEERLSLHGTKMTSEQFDLFLASAHACRYAINPNKDGTKDITIQYETIDPTTKIGQEICFKIIKT